MKRFVSKLVSPRAPRAAPLYRRALGHYWTIAPHFTGRGGRRLLADQPFAWEVADARHVRVLLSGSLTRAEPPSPDLLVAVHGLGGSSDSAYMLRMAAAAERAGIDCLRVNLRGADRRGQDLFHAGQCEDLEALFGEPSLATYRRFYFVGFSLGGHVCLRLGTSDNPRLGAIAAICPPLDLEQSSAAFDRVRWVYRVHVLDGLKAMYRALRPDRKLELSSREVSRIATIRAWDERIVAPRYQFASAVDYYRTMSVASRLERTVAPTLLLAAEHDPMVPISSLEQGLVACSSVIEVRRVTWGGHVGFPRSLDLGQPGARGLESQVLGWFGEQGANGAP